MTAFKKVLRQLQRFTTLNANDKLHTLLAVKVVVLQPPRQSTTLLYRIMSRLTADQEHF